MVFLVGFVAGDATDSSVRQDDLLLRQQIFRVEAALHAGIAVAAPDRVGRRAAGVAQDSVAAHADRPATRVTTGVATQAIQGMGIDVDGAAPTAHIQMPRNHQRASCVFHVTEKRLVMTGQTKILAMLVSAQQPRLAAVRQVASAAGQLTLPIKRILRRQTAPGDKTTGMAHLQGTLVALYAQQLLGSDQLRRLRRRDIQSGNVAGAATGS